MATEQQIYIRFGAWSEKEQSYHHWLKQPERGVSVYQAAYDPKAKAYHMVRDPQLHGEVTVIGLVVYTRRPVYIVTGDEVGRGSDGEPLLRNLRIIDYAVTAFSGVDVLHPSALSVKHVSKAFWDELQTLRKADESVVLHILPRADVPARK